MEERIFVLMAKLSLLVSIASSSIGGFGGLCSYVRGLCHMMVGLPE